MTNCIRPAFPNPPPPAYKSLIERCWSHDPSKRPSFDPILIELRENAEFIDDSIDKEDFFTYVEYVESRQSIPFEIFNTKESKTFSKVRIQSIQIDDSKSSPKNGYQSIEVLKKSEDVDDIYRCGLLLMTGREVPVDLKIACQFFKEAADRGKAEAMNSYAWMLENGYGHCIDLEQASKYEKAADLGWMLFSGKGVLADKGKSSMYFKMAADKGHPNPIGGHFIVDFCEAYRYYKMAADRGQIEAMNNLGIMLEKGAGITVDKREAAKYYRVAADMGQPNAMYNLGWMLWSVAGVAADREEAARYFK